MRREYINDNWIFYKKGCRDAAIPVTLPHDAMLHETRDPDCPGGSDHAFFPGGVYEYERILPAPAEWAGKQVSLYFEGVYKNAGIFLNGEKLAFHAYGYTPFLVDLTGHLRPGEDNRIQVEADCSQFPNSRWYPGGGLYRPVSLLVAERTHIAWHGVKITTLSHNPAQVRVETAIEGDMTGTEVRVELADGEGVVLAGTGADIIFDIPDAKLWNEDSPNLYICRVSLLRDGTILDEAEEAFGIRKIEWNAGGLFVHGQETLLRGGCIHHDNGVLGACALPEAEERRVRIMKESGFNAIRSAHNPCSEAMLAACDKYGVFLMDETFDMWYMGKTKFDYHLDFEACWKDDVRAMVERDFNHPSVLMLSIGNEVSEPAEAKGIEIGKALADYARSLDSTRPVTCGTNLMIITRAAGGKGIYKDPDANQKEQAKTSQKDTRNVSLIFNTMASFIGTGMNKAANSDKADKLTSPFLDCLDIAGYNYASGRYRMDGKKHPGRLIVGSETFPQDIGKNWAMVRQLPYLIGDFMWAGWDYLGEAGIGTWSYDGGLPFARPYPWILGGSGVIDLTGAPDVSCRFAQVVWDKIDRPVIGVQPVNHPGKRPTRSVWRATNAMEGWAWQGCEGNRAVVEVYSKGTHVQLFLNGKSLGRKKLKDCKAVWKVKYQPGELSVAAYDGTREIGRHALPSARDELSLRLIPEVYEDTSNAVVFLPIEITDIFGTVERNADRNVTVTVEGGELLGLGSANPCTEQRYDGNTFSTYYGRALAVIRKAAGKTAVTVTAEGLSSATVTL